ncbi:MAG: hypothetical protein AAFR04_08545 [Pseudomonadota bacterium]
MAHHENSEAPERVTKTEARQGTGPNIMLLVLLASLTLALIIGIALAGIF